MTSYLHQRDPALLVLAYGSNEASDGSWTGDSYREMFSALLRRLREDCPAASILVLGPTDRMTLRGGIPVEVEGIDRIIAAQRQACTENGCAYWCAKKRMGGSGSMRDWTRTGLGQADYVHFTPAGYHRLAGMLFEDITQLYDAYLGTRTSARAPHPNDGSQGSRVSTR